MTARTQQRLTWTTRGLTLAYMGLILFLSLMPGDEVPPTLTRAPGHGEHTDEVLRELGIDDDELIRLKIDNAIL